MKKIKIYVGCAIKHAPDDYKQRISDFKNRLASEVNCKILDFVFDPDATPGEVYYHDIIECIKKEADIIIADITFPSLGLGYEMATMIEAVKKPVIGLAKDGSVISKLILGIPNFHVLFYINLDDMLTVAKMAVKSLRFHQKGKLIALYSQNNLGKTTQVEKLLNFFNGERTEMLHQKFPVYTIEPTGPVINNYLRPLEGVKNPFHLTPREFQILNVANRYHFDPQIRNWISEGKIILVEDYIGTGVAWGMAAGIDRDFLLKLNDGLYQADLSVMLDGKRFMDNVEKNHLHESNNELMEKAARAHLELAHMFQWKIVNGNRSVEEVNNELRKIIGNFLIEDSLLATA